MKIKFFETLVCLILLLSTAFTQENPVVNEGIFLRALSTYNNLSGNVEGSSSINRSAKVTATMNGSFGFGMAVGYLAHGKGDFDASVELSYNSSQHQMEYEYPPLTSIVFGPNVLSGVDTLSINNLSFSSLS